MLFCSLFLGLDLRFAPMVDLGASAAREHIEGN
jgi:hypothetical protein